MKANAWLGLRVFAVLCLTGLGLAYVCAQDGGYVPPRQGAWERAPLRLSKGVDTVRLREAIVFAQSHEYSGPRDLRQAILEGFKQEPYHEILGPVRQRGGPAGLILKDGYIIASWGDTDRVDMAFSVTKSFLSTIAGLALDYGLITSLTDTAVDYVWDGTFDGPHNQRIQWKHLLEQNSDWSGSLWGLKDWADRPPKEGNVDTWKFTPPREPGTVMEYNDVRVNVLAHALTQVWRKPLPEVLRDELMDPIGASTTWRWHGYEQAWSVIDGRRVQSVTGGGHSGGGLFINTWDMARFGLLYEKQGIWGERRLLSRDWFDRVTTPSVPNPRYGLLWWLNTKPEGEWARLPDTLFYAAGFGGNFIVIDREKDLVVVCRWLDPPQLPLFLQRVYKAMR